MNENTEQDAPTVEQSAEQSNFPPPPPAPPVGGQADFTADPKKRNGFIAGTLVAVVVSFFAGYQLGDEGDASAANQRFGPPGSGQGFGQGGPGMQGGQGQRDGGQSWHQGGQGNQSGPGMQGQGQGQGMGGPPSSGAS